jgi:hypothetical protein
MAVVAGAITGAFVLGRFTAPEMPERVVEKTVEKVVEKVDERKVTQLQQENQSLKQEVAQLSLRIRRTEHTVTRPDGTVEVVKTEEVDKTETKATQEVKVEIREVKVTETKIVDRIIEKEVLVEKLRRPDWRVSALVGLNVPNLGQVTELSVGGVLPALALGASVDRRIIGPVSAGVWGLSSGQFGLGVSFEF